MLARPADEGKVVKFSENQFRDHLFLNHKETLGELVVGRRDPVSWDKKEFPPLRFILQQISEQRINQILDGLDSLVLTAKELRLERTNDSTTRVDLFGTSESSGLTIIELKKSKQTERQAFTELLAYANHFCSIFPGTDESTTNAILIGPMATRTVRDAFAQEVILNRKAVAALIPKEVNGDLLLEVCYPDESYYRWFENNLLDDRSMLTVVVAFQNVPGWIDSDRGSENCQLRSCSKAALNTVASSISSGLQAEGFHSLVYASKKWGEIESLFPYPNSIVVVLANPFATFRTASHEGEIYGASDDGRLGEVQAVLNQLDESEREFWLEAIESNFHDRAIRTTRVEFEKCFANTEGKNIGKEISLPDWYGLKTSMIDSVFVHNLDVFQTGLLREIYLRYVEHIFETEYDPLYFSDDLPKYSYQALRDFMPVWEILRGLGLGGEHA